MSYGQAILDGNNSVKDPRFPGSRLPLWCIQFWKEMLTVIDTQARWRRSLAWINSHLNKVDSQSVIRSTLQAAHTHFLSLQWNESTTLPSTGSQTMTQIFAWLLSDKWINDTLIDMMFSHLSECADEDTTLDSFVIIETMQFSSKVLSYNLNLQ